MSEDEKVAWKAVSTWELARLIETGAEVPLWLNDRQRRMRDAMDLLGFGGMCPSMIRGTEDRAIAAA